MYATVRFNGGQAILTRSGDPTRPRRARPGFAASVMDSSPEKDPHRLARAPRAVERDSLRALERGLSALSAFGPGRTALTLSDMARATGMTRASARRILLTFEALGYVRCEGRHFSLTPRVLDLGWAYLRSLHVDDVAKPVMRRLVGEVGESAALSALDGGDVVYLARVHTPHLLTVPGGIGARLPAAATAAGRVLLAGRGPAGTEEFLRSTPLVAHTHRSVVDRDAFRSLLASVERRGWALVDEELELGLRAIAAPVRDREGDAVAALSVSSSTSRVTVEHLQDRCLPALRRAAEQISLGLRSEAPA
jgi:IclR family pca regulon transcriptional regulator